MIPDEAIARLARLDTCAVSDALDRLGLKGAVVGIGPLWPCGRVVGRCVTVKIKPAGLEKSKQHLCTAAIAAATPTDVIVVDNGGRADVAAWGGLLSLAAQSRQVRGAVVDGACRDWTKAASSGFRSMGARRVQVTARGRIVQQSFNEEIAFAGVQVHPGDRHRRQSGVVFVPRAREAEVILQAEALAQREAAMAAAIRGGRSVVEVMETMGYESMLAGKTDRT